ncbi:MAG TPA: glycine--tRNA ligase subunit beta [Acidobacteriota bacterium]|nr:glycine--tRNA ligase subunit beta [Acidobacteriota bacterium]
MPELILEIGTEEIPADDLEKIPSQLKELAGKSFEDNRLDCSKIETYATPRRITLFADVSSMQKDLREQRMGPAKKVAIDSAGNPTPAALGFARNAGIPFEQLKVVSTPKGEYLSAEILVKGKKTAEVLGDAIVTIVKSLSFKKFMKWGSEDFVFGRPIRNLVLLFDNEVIPINIAGVQSGRTTFGHRFLGSQKIEVEYFDRYRKKLEENGVILAFDDRTERIRKGLQQNVSDAKGVLLEDEDLLHTMANEVEYPQVLTGTFSSEFLSLPQEILINAMRKHQKYFSATDSNGKLLPVFFTILNTRTSHPEEIRKGHERVLMARLRDAEFFWREDLKIPLKEFQKKLSRVTYHEKLGSYSEKIKRMLSISEQIIKQSSLDDIGATLRKLIELSKADLVTLMVGEFPELQGMMSGLHGREMKMPEQEWQALYDQYLPASAEGKMPRNQLGALVSLIDRIEILASGYVLNMIPTGSRDPYALRRAATGIIRILLEFRLPIDLMPVLDHAFTLYERKTKLTRGEMLHAVLELLENRFRFLMEQRGIAHDYLNAILAIQSGSSLDAFYRANALWSKNASEDLKTLARCFKRINNIISNQDIYEFDATKLVEDGEKRLNQVFTDMEFRVQQLIQEEKYLDALDIMVTLGSEIDNFFDEVLVMAEDEQLRKNRIALLQRISHVYRKIADFSELQIEG